MLAQWLCASCPTLSLRAGQWLMLGCSTVCLKCSGPQAEARWGQSLATRGLVTHTCMPCTQGILTPSDAQAEKSREFLHPQEEQAQKAGWGGESEQGQGLKCAFRRCGQIMGRQHKPRGALILVWEAAFWRAETCPSWSLVSLGSE